MRAIGVAWGYRTDRELMDAGALAVLQHPLDLLRISGIENNQRGPSGG
jgi:phosphoglycolate phosphatase-like HAD superfamily hydrolase